MDIKDVLKCFMYMLARDEVVPGAINRILQDIENCVKIDDTNEFTYTNKHIAAYAEDVVNRLYKCVKSENNDQ